MKVAGQEAGIDDPLAVGRPGGVEVEPGASNRLVSIFTGTALLPAEKGHEPD
jgi:hypothetical protein